MLIVLLGGTPVDEKCPRWSAGTRSAVGGAAAAGVKKAESNRI